MSTRTNLLRLSKVGVIAAAALLALAVALPRIAGQSTQPSHASDALPSYVGGLEAWYFERGYTEAPPPAARQSQWQTPPSPLSSLVSASATLTPTAYLPMIARNFPPNREFRGVWVSRFDWTGYHVTPTEATIDTLVHNVAMAHFNAILFQVRGIGDAFYTPGLEPWSARLTGEPTKTLGVNPGWDPLAHLISQAHKSGIQVHAYINVFPAWICQQGAPPDATSPMHLFWTLSYSTAGDAWRIWTASGPQSYETCSDYLWATPALSLTRDHVAAVATDLVTRYDVDGVHLDLVRYPSSNTSYDPFTRQAYTDALVLSPTLTFTQWQPVYQRAQISGFVSQVYSAITDQKPKVWLSAAVWPNYTSGYNSYFQDSKGWLAAGIIDANMPMLYSSDIVNDLPAWIARMQGFVADSYGRYVIPGIHADYPNFNDLVDRIEAARAAGASGVSIFSYGALNLHGYFDDLGSGPFAEPAEVPTPGWKP